MSASDYNDDDEEVMWDDDDDGPFIEDDDDEDDDDGSEGDDSYDDQNYGVSDGTDERAECIRLSLPSCFTEDKRVRYGLKTLAVQEIELRKGQANDALQGLRLAIGQKTLLYRNKLRVDNTTQKKLRSRKEVREVQSKVMMHARSYERARKALQRLGETEQNIYKSLKVKDLHLSADILEENRYNQKDDQLAWFWRIGDGNIVDPKSWMAECIFFLLSKTRENG